MQLSRTSPLAALALTLVIACSTGSSPVAVPEAKDAGGKKSADAGGSSRAGSQGPARDEAGNAPETASGTSEPAAPPYKTSSRSLVLWKRQAAFEADLMTALELPREQLCTEVGGKSCVVDVHLVPLGGNDPYESGLFKPSAEPLATTSSVVDRVLLSACSTRARLDATQPPKVFTALDLKRPLPSAGDPALATTVRDLYRRLLARDPTPREVELVTALAEDGDDGALSSQHFVALACFAIGSSTEFLFF